MSGAEQQLLEKKLDREVASHLKKSELTFRISVRNPGYSDLFSDKLLMITLIRSGVSYSFYELIKQYTPFEDEDWVVILDLSSKSLQRYRVDAKQFGPLQSEKIMEMAEVSNIGLDVFGSMEKFRLWLETPNFALGKLKPKELLRDSYGKDLVVDELTRINHGILA